MNNITITIQAPELIQAMQALTAALEQGTIKPATIEAHVEQLKAEAAKPVKSKKASSESQATSSGVTAETVTALQPSIEEVRTVLGTLSQQGKQAQVKALIASFGAMKLTEIDKTQYADLLAKAEAL